MIITRDECVDIHDECADIHDGYSVVICNKYADNQDD